MQKYGTKEISNKELEDLGTWNIKTALRYFYDNADNTSADMAKKVLKRVPRIRSTIENSTNPDKYQNILILTDVVEKRLQKIFK